MFEKLLTDLIKGGAFLGTLYLIFGSRTEVKKWVVINYGIIVSIILLAVMFKLVK